LFHYNLGTLQVKLGNYALGRYHLEKAINQGFANEKSYKNLTVSKNLLKQNGMVDVNHWSTEIKFRFLSGPSDLILTFSLLLVLLGIFISRKRMNLKKVILALSMGLLPYLYGVYLLNSTNIGITLGEVVVYEGPSKIFPSSGSIPAGSKLILSSIKDDWFFIKGPEGYVGWIEKSQLGIL
jgi:hypothetical protein